MSSSKDKKENNVVSSIPESAFEEALRAVESIERKQKLIKIQKNAAAKTRLSDINASATNIENDAEDLDSLLNLLETQGNSIPSRSPENTRTRQESIKVKATKVPEELSAINGLLDEELSFKKEADFFRDILFDDSKQNNIHKTSVGAKGQPNSQPRTHGIGKAAGISEYSEAEVKELNEKLVRLQANFENYRKRITREIEEAKKYHNEKLILELLPIVDNFERAIEHMQEPSGQQSLVEGVQLIFRQILGMLQSNGLRTIDTFEQLFNPLYHEAVSMVYNPGVKPGMIIAEYETGYLFNGRLLRPSKVLVSTAENGNSISGDSDQEQANNNIESNGEENFDRKDSEKNSSKNTDGDDNASNQ